MQRGVCFAHNYQDQGRRGYGSDEANAQLTELRALGAGWVSITPFGFMSSLDSVRVEHIGEYPGGESDARVRATIAAARERGLHVMLKPHIWVRGGEWRAEIEPVDGQWDAWFRSYTAWMLRYAEIAQESGAEILAIGTELRSSATRYPRRWRALNEAVRHRFFGHIVYCANWDEVEEIEWWRSVDYIGVQFYPQLAEGPDASDASIRARLDTILDNVEAVSRRWQRPVLLTEVGYKSVRGAMVRPYEWTERVQNPEVDTLTQLRAYRLFLDEVRDRERIEGIYLWKWFSDPNTREEGPAGFSPRGKPAEASIRAAYAGCPTARGGVEPHRESSSR